MRLVSTLASPHFPDANLTSVMQLGITPLDTNDWIKSDTDFDQFYRHKQSVKNTYDDKVFFEMPESRHAQQEFHQTLINHLTQDLRYQTLSGIEPARESFKSLWRSALLIQDDICLLTPTNDGYALTAASVCSPSNWPLEQKHGKNLDFIHAPVSGYAEALGDRVNRLFAKLKPDAPLLRFNWSIQDSNELFWRADIQARVDKPRWHWRVERQTLRRLPKSGAVVFAIRIYLNEFTSLPSHTAQSLLTMARRLPGEQIQYKNLSRWLNEYSGQ